LAILLRVNMANFFFRCHTVSQFNKGVYSVIVAADETLLDEGQTPKVGLSLSSCVADPGSGAFLIPWIPDV
jgi:hypothetical protein